MNGPASQRVAHAPPTSVPAQTVLIVFLVIAGVCFFANYLFSAGFGLYEDDYSYTLPGLAWTPSDLTRELRGAFTATSGGRPLGLALNNALAFATGRFPTLQPAYLAGWLILSVNGVLLSALLRPLLGSFPSLVAGLIYVTYPVDASKTILMHRAFLHLGMTELLLALVLFQRRRLGWSHAVAACTLITYESFYLPFIIAPLLCLDPRWRRPGALLRHAVAVAAVAATAVAIRYLAGESRAALLVTGLPDNALRIVTAPIIGSWTALWALVARPVDVLLSMSPWIWTVAIFALLLSRLVFRAADTADDPADTSLRAARPWVLAIAGLAALAVPYVLSFRVNYYPPIMNIGRLSGVHAAGAFGATLAIAAALAAIPARDPAARRRVRMVSAVWMGLLVTSGIQIQLSEYVTSWKLQGDFWRAIVRQAADATDGTVVVIDGSLMDSRTAGFLTVQSVLGDPSVLPRWIAPSTTWRDPPLLTCNIDGYNGHVAVAGGAVRTSCPSWWQHWPVLRDGQFIMFRLVGGVYERVLDETTIGGQTLKPKPVGPPNPQLQVSDLYRRLFEQTPANTWFRFGHACWHTTACER